MMKKILGSICVSVLFLMTIWGMGNIKLHAQETNPPRVVDEADILTETEEMELKSLVDEVSERQQVDVVIVTTKSLQGEDIQDYAADYYDYHGYGIGEDNDGIMLLISMEEREWFILTTGFGMDILDDTDLEILEGDIVPYLSTGEYAEAFKIFAEGCDVEASYAHEDEVEESKPSILIAVLIGLILGLIPAFAMRGKLKTVHMQSNAGRYVDKGSKKVTTRQDIFLYHTINRVPKLENNHNGSSTFTGSSGQSHGGRGGGF